MNVSTELGLSGAVAEGSSTAPAAKGAEPDALANKEVFLQLLVAQIKNQDPLSPTDGIEFVTQLAQFTQLEQTLSIRGDLAAIRASLEANEKQAPSSETTTGD